MFDYIDNDFGKQYVSRNYEARRGVHVPRSIVDINDGNIHDGIIFSQILFWHEPSLETGKTRLRKKMSDGRYWLYKNHSDWYTECRIKANTAKKCLGRIKERKLILYELHGANGNSTPHMRINWDEFERRMRLWESFREAFDDESCWKDNATFDDAISAYSLDDPVPEIGGGVPEIGDPVPEIYPNTESTKNTPQKRGGKNPPNFGIFADGQSVTEPKGFRSKASMGISESGSRSAKLIADVFGSSIRSKKITSSQYEDLLKRIKYGENEYPSPEELAEDRTRVMRDYLLFLKEWMQSKNESITMGSVIKKLCEYGAKWRGLISYTSRNHIQFGPESGIDVADHNNNDNGGMFEDIIL